MGLVPVIDLWNVNISTVLHEESRTGTGGRKARVVRRLLIVAQVGLAFVLLIGSGLLLASFRNLLTVDPGFRADGVATASIGMPRALYPSDKDVRSFTDRVLKAIRKIARR